VNNLHASAGVKYVAVLPHVREIGLLGSSDLALWKDRLVEDNLSPTDFDGKARVLISAIESRFLGIKFREVCISVFAHRDKCGARQDGLFLAVAFNSSRVLAAAERTLFSTPYRHGEIRVDVGLPTSIALFEGDEVAFGATMAADGPASRREPLRIGPRDRHDRNASGKWFFAKVGGHTRVYPFLAPGDEVTAGPSYSQETLRWVMEAGFSGQEWVIREDSTHARTKTFGKGQGRGLGRKGAVGVGRTGNQ
jgi:hypothetical protein